MATSTATNQAGRSLAGWFLTKLQPALSSRLKAFGLDNIGIILFCLFTAIVFLMAVGKPQFNWDMAPYLASAMQDNFASAQELHTKVWSLMQAGSSESQFYKLTAGNPYNLHNYEHPSAFVSMLPMYDVKLAYIAAIKFAGQYIGVVNGSIWISAVSSLALSLVCLFWMFSRGFLQAAPIVALTLLLSGYLYMSRIVTPDLAVAVFIVAGAERFVRGKDWLAAAFLFVAFLFRPDTIVFIFALLLATLMFNKRILPVLVSFVAAIGMSVWIHSSPDHIGWWTHFYFSCIEIQNTMIGFDPDFSLVAYLKGLARGMIVSLDYNNWPMLLGLLIIGWGLLGASGKQVDERGTILIWAVLLGFVGKFIVFPLPDDRLYMPLVMCFLMVLLETWKPKFDTLLTANKSH